MIETETGFDKWIMPLVNFEKVITKIKLFLKNVYK